MIQRNHRHIKTKTPRIAITAADFEEILEEALLSYADAVEELAKTSEEVNPVLYEAVLAHYHTAHEDLKAFVRRNVRLG